CVVLQSSPGHLQAWIRVSTTPLEPALATAVSKQLARTYGGDLASTDACHLGRLAGFTNQKLQRRTARGYAPRVKIVEAHAGISSPPGLVKCSRPPRRSGRLFASRFGTCCSSPPAPCVFGSGHGSSPAPPRTRQRRLPPPRWTIAPPRFFLARCLAPGFHRNI